MSVFPKVLFLEPFYGGSHKSLIDNFTSDLLEHEIISLPAKKWHWRARCGALSMYDLIPTVTTEKILFCSSVLSLAELLGLRPDLNSLKKIVYFHENQLIYPVRETKERDVQYAYNQITSCLAADVVLFNSHFNKDSFLGSVNKAVKMLPDCRPKHLREKIEPKCRVMYFPVDYPKVEARQSFNSVLHIVWPHRWEFDKGPDDFFGVLIKLKQCEVPFKVSILGESFTDNPPIFTEAKNTLRDVIVNFGYIGTKCDFYNVLAEAHVVVSTAKHEFFGVSMLEATYCGCYPLAPNALVYPEIYPNECLFDNLDELFVKLKDFCLNPQLALEARRHINIDFAKYAKETVVHLFKEIINDLQ